MTTRALILTVLLLGILLPATGSAHERSASHSTVHFDESDAHVLLSLSAHELEVLLDAAASAPSAEGRDVWARAYVTSQLQVASDRGVCPVLPASVRSHSAAPGRVAWEWIARCPPGPAELRIESRLFADSAPHHLHFASITFGALTTDQVLTEGHRSASVRGSRGDSGGVLSYVSLGADHILTGYDHLAFLLALLVVARSFGAVARVVTGFTVGHSLTLALAVLGWIHPDTKLVEAAIGVSIAVVATENVWARSGYRGTMVPAAVVIALLVAACVEVARAPGAARALGGIALAVACYFALLRRSASPTTLRGGIAAAFGLVHGLGFASCLTEQTVQSPHVFVALVGFNFGVELGQLAAGGLVWFALQAALSRREGARTLVEATASAATCGAGVYWTVLRLA